MVSKVAGYVNEKLLKALDAGIVPWVKPWKSGPKPQNLFGHHVYRGINSLLTHPQVCGYDSPFWATFKQVSEHGGKVKKGEHGTMIVFWTFVPAKGSDPKDPKAKKIPLLRYYLVFNIAAQTEGLEKYLPVAEAVEAPSADEATITAQSFIDRYFAEPGAPKLAFGGDSACYSPSMDVINLPPASAFRTTVAYYGTAYHEMGHSTGHDSRLKRDLSGTFGSKLYAREELVAEICACYLCAEAGLEPDIGQSAAYIATWKARADADPMLFIAASGRAAAAAEYVMASVASEEDVDLSEAV